SAASPAAPDTPAGADAAAPPAAAGTPAGPGRPAAHEAGAGHRSRLLLVVRLVRRGRRLLTRLLAGLDSRLHFLGLTAGLGIAGDADHRILLAQVDQLDAHRVTARLPD